MGAETQDDDPCDERVEEGLVEDFDDEVEVEVFVPFLSGPGRNETRCCCDFLHLVAIVFGGDKRSGACEALVSYHRSDAIVARLSFARLLNIILRDCDASVAM